MAKYEPLQKTREPRTWFPENAQSKYNPAEFFHHKRQTNADRIRQMSDEDMAAFFNEDFLCPPGYATADGMLLTDKCVYHNDSDDEPCRRCWLDWLQQEVDNG